VAAPEAKFDAYNCLIIILAHVDICRKVLTDFNATIMNHRVMLSCVDVSLCNDPAPRP